MNRWLQGTITAACLLAAFGEAAAREILFVHNTHSGEISKIAIPEHEIIGSIDVGFYMDYVNKSPDGKVLYVNRIDGFGEGMNYGESGELIAIDPKTDRFLWRLKLEHMPHHMTASADGRYVFVPFYDSWWLAVIDTEQRRVVKKILTGHGGHGTKLSHDGKRLYVGSMMNDTISIIDTERLENIGRIGFRDGVRPFIITRDDKWMYVQQSWLHGFLKVNLETGEKVARIDLPKLPDEVKPPEFYPHNVNHGLALTPNESMLLANGSAADYVAVYTHPGLELIKTIPVGDDPNAIAIDKAGRYAYVTNRASDDLSIISLETLEEVKRMKLGKYPQRMVIIDVPE